MTLLVAGIDGQSLWMVSDTAVTGAGVPLRERENLPKIVPSLDGQALIGFAGTADELASYNGPLLVRKAAALSPESAVDFLVEEHRRHRGPSGAAVDFAYGYVSDDGPHLYRITDGSAAEVQTLHLGDHDAFEHFQRVRLAPGLDTAPEAMKTYFFGARDRPPKALTDAVVAMFRVFTERGDPSVGGWAVPYFLNVGGTALLCQYGFSVSDPIFTLLTPGSIVPHGTAEAGGFALSVTEFGTGEGIVVYWLQRPGGTVYIPTEAGFDTVKFEGPPSTFISAASAALGRPVEILFGDRPPEGPVKKISILRDEHGRPSMAVADHGGSFTISVLNVADPFHAAAALDLARHQPGERTEVPIGPLTINVSDKKDRVQLSLAAGVTEPMISLTADEVDSLIAALAGARVQLSDQVSSEPPRNPGTEEIFFVDPTWRVEAPPHPSVPGVILRLRHPGRGWVGFVVPFHEARALAHWIFKLSPVPSSGEIGATGKQDAEPIGGAAQGEGASPSGKPTGAD